MKLISMHSIIKNVEQKNIILFLHIPKTAGTSFLTVLRNVFSDERIIRIISPHSELEPYFLDLMQSDLSSISCITGHIPRYIWQKHESEMRIFTLLRHPIDRVFSLYRFLSLASSTELAEIGLLPGFTFDEFLSTYAPGTYSQVNNGMSRMLSSDRSFNNPDDNAFWNTKALAEQLPSHLTFLGQTDFGIVEEMGKTLRLIEKSWNIPYEIEEYRENSTSSERNLLTVENINRIVELNTVDIALYHAACKIFHERVKDLVVSEARTTGQTVWQGTLGTDTNISEISGRQGFYATEDYNFSWLMFENVPIIHFLYPIELLGKEAWIKLRIYMVTPSYNAASIVIKLNHNRLDFTVSEREENWCTLTVGPILADLDIQQLTIELPYVVPVHIIEPSSMDRRHLGVALATVGFRDQFQDD